MRWNNKYKVRENNGEMKNALKASNKQRRAMKKWNDTHKVKGKSVVKNKSDQKQAINNGKVIKKQWDEIAHTKVFKQGKWHELINRSDKNKEIDTSDK